VAVLQRYDNTWITLDGTKKIDRYIEMTVNGSFTVYRKYYTVPSTRPARSTLWVAIIRFTIIMRTRSIEDILKIEKTHNTTHSNTHNSIYYNICVVRVFILNLKPNIMRVTCTFEEVKKKFTGGKFSVNHTTSSIRFGTIVSQDHQSDPSGTDAQPRRRGVCVILHTSTTLGDQFVPYILIVQTSTVTW